MNWKVIYDKEMLFIPEDRVVRREDDKVVEYVDGGTFHKNNRLNDLDSKTWLKFQKSWYILNPRARGEDVLLHPAKFPEELVREFIEFFTKKGQTVLDPMLGTGSTLVACTECGRNGVGVELLEKYAEISAQRLKKIVNQRRFSTDDSFNISLKVIQGDSRYLSEMGLQDIDYCVTSPPYWDMLTEKGFETQREREEKDLDVHYSEDENDIGNIHSYEKFLDELEAIYSQVFRVMKHRGYMTVIVKNVKKKNLMYPLAWDIGKRLSKFFKLKDEKIWCQNDVRLAPYGYRNAWVSNTVHHYCLNFRKE